MLVLSKQERIVVCKGKENKMCATNCRCQNQSCTGVQISGMCFNRLRKMSYPNSNGEWGQQAITFKI